MLTFQWAVNKNSSYSPVGACVCLFMLFRLHVYFLVCSVLHWSVESFPFKFCTGITNLNESPSSFLLPLHYCRLGAGSIPVRAIVNKTIDYKRIIQNKN